MLERIDPEPAPDEGRNVPASGAEGWWRRGVRGARFRRMIAEWWLVLLGATVAIVACGMLAPPVRLDNLFYDMVARVMPARAKAPILIVAIDNDSIRDLGRWPWGRAVHARLLDRLTEAGAAVVGYDVLFTERETEGGGEADTALARAIARNGRVVLPAVVDRPRGLSGAPVRMVPIAPFLDAAAAVGNVGVRPDADGVVRGFSAPPPVGEDRAGDLVADRRAAPPMANFAAAVASLAAKTGPPAGRGGRDTAGARIVFAGPSGSFPEIGFAEVLAGRVPPELIRGRIVLVGATASGLGDRFATPMSGSDETMPGVELNANYANSLLQGQLIRAAPPWLIAVFSLLPLWLLMLSLRFFGPRINIWVGIALGLAVLALSFAALAFARFWLPPALAMLAILLLFPLWGWRRLDVASRYMIAELQGFRREGTVIPRKRSMPGGDPIERQIAMMHEAIRDVRDLRRFIAQSLDSLPDAAVVTDLSGEVVIANEAADVLFAARLARPPAGCSLHELLRSFDRDARLQDSRAEELLRAMGHADRAGRAGLADDEKARARPHGADAPPQGPRGYELRLQDGRSIDIRIAAFSDHEGKPLGWIARFADITAIRASERRREDTLRLLTHDMRAPQAAILAVLDSEGGKVPPDVAQRIAHYARQTLGLADDFVHLERAKSGRFDIALFNLADALLDAVDDLWPLADAAGITIHADVPEEEVLVNGDRALVTRSISNLLGNALKYSARGTHVGASVTTGPGWADCSIRDQGVGIAPEDLSRLFEAFSRLRRENPSGAGLGLAFVKAVIERHSGTVHVASEEGRGSTFGFRLPLAAASGRAVVDAGREGG